MWKQLIGASVACALIVAAPAAYAQKKKEKCKDGETDKVASYTAVKGVNIDWMIKTSLTGKDGDPKAGLKWMTHRRLGNCIACHEVSKIKALAKADDAKSLKAYGFHGEIAPTLDGVADRYTVGELRMLVVNPKKIFPETIMPGFHVNQGLNRVIGDCEGLAILTAERVEDIIAYLKTLKE
ncbi:MAG: sulfur oxidation c-type cytochrome SoxX [Methyloligellaceae bacterium]